MDLLKACSAPFKALGKNRLGVDEFRRFLVFRLGWFSPKEVDKLITLALSRRILDKNGETLVYKGLNMVDEKKVKTEKPRDVESYSKLFERIVGTIIEETGLPREQVLEEVERKHRKYRELIPEIEFAATLVAWERGVDVSHLHEEVLKRVKAGTG